jgi:hypothetical protein
MESGGPTPDLQASAGSSAQPAKTHRSSWHDGLVACGDSAPPVIELLNKELHLTRGAASNAAPRR